MIKDILWVGGVSWGDDYIKTVLKGNNQWAANNTQVNMIKGIQNQIGKPLTIISGQMFPSYPKYKELFVKPKRWSHCDGSHNREVFFITLPLVKLITKAISMCFHTFHWAKKNNGQGIVFVYSLHTPFILAGIAAKIRNPNLHLCCIVPDLPEYVDFNIDKKPIKKFFKRVDKRLINKLLKYMDSFIFFTEHFNKRLNKAQKPWMLMEGIINAEEYLNTENFIAEKRILLYSGKVEMNFGIPELIEAFKLLTDDDLELWILGDGNASNYVKTSATSDKRIKYMGFISERKEVLKMQKKATLLLNMQNPTADVAKYIFPSKIMEYMASGTPVATFKLPGIPDEYNEYVYYMDYSGIEGIYRSLETILSQNMDELKKKGIEARNFVMKNKNYNTIGETVVKFLEKKINTANSNTKKKLLFVSYELELGGTAISLLSLLNNIDYDKYEVDLLLRKNEGDLLHRVPVNVNILPAADIRVNMIKKIMRFFSALFDGYLIRYILYKLGFKVYKSELVRLQHGTYSQLKLSRKLNKVYDAAIGFMELWPNAYVARCVKAKKKIGWVHPDYIDSGLEQRYDKKSYLSLDYIIGVAKSSVETLKSLFPELKSRIIMIENINNAKYIRECAKKPALEMSNSNEDMLFITVNRLDCYCKGIDRAIIAAANLKKEGFNFKWYVIGDGDDKNKILGMIKEYAVEDCFIMLGKKVNPYLYIAKADLFVLCSRYEGKPITVTEAQILGIPVLVTNYKSAAEQVIDGKNGMIVENNDFGVYNGLKELLTHPELLKHYKESLNNNENVFNNEKEIEKLYDLIEGDGAYNGENR